MNAGLIEFNNIITINLCSFRFCISSHASTAACFFLYSRTNWFPCIDCYVFLSLLTDELVPMHRLHACFSLYLRTKRMPGARTAWASGEAPTGASMPGISIPGTWKGCLVNVILIDNFKQTRLID